MSFFNTNWFKENVLQLQPDEPEPDDLNEDKRTELEKEYLQSVAYDQVDYFHLKGLKTWAKVVRVYDADTLYVVLFLNSKPFKFKIRLDCIDTAELTSKDPLEKVWAEKARDHLISLVSDGLVWVECGKYDKYGRVLGKIFTEPGTLSVNDQLLQLGYGYPYWGKKRKNFRQWAPAKALALESVDQSLETDVSGVRPITPPSGPEEILLGSTVDHIQDSAVKNETEGPQDYQSDTNVEETMSTLKEELSVSIKTST